MELLEGRLPNFLLTVLGTNQEKIWGKNRIHFKLGLYSFTRIYSL
jgi:hypothetical protein